MSIFLLLCNTCHTIIVDLPPHERLDDLASLLQIDSKNLDVRQLGLDAIKEQLKINLKFSSNKTAILPEDKIQVMLAGVSFFDALKHVRYYPQFNFAFKRFVILLNCIPSPLVIAVTPILRNAQDAGPPFMMRCSSSSKCRSLWYSNN